jgi:very-short-patch-repair endonuclease
MLPYNKKLKKYSRDLRKDMTFAERLLWEKIRRKQLKDHQFYRQKILGNYIVDFYCAKANLVVEVDGSQHYLEEGRKKDKKRDDYLNKLGLKVLRFSNREVTMDLESVVKDIWNHLS